MTDNVTGYSPLDSWLVKQKWFNSSFHWLTGVTEAQAKSEDANLILSLGFAMSIICAVVYMAMGGGVLDLISVLIISGYLGILANTDRLPTSGILQYLSGHGKLAYLIMIVINGFNILEGLFTGQLLAAIVGLLTSAIVLGTVFVAVGVADWNRVTEE